MTKKEEAARLVKKGLSPREIARKMGKTMWEIQTYLFSLIAERRLTRSDILLTISAEEKEAFESHIESYRGHRGKKGHWALIESAKLKGMDFEQLRIYVDCRDPKVSQSHL
ncbi:MAG: hypothetical protein AMJ46_10010 [Latescibacteria bacterium DG_63]|nr:MAG: hypothetical protein AMJ46_10010 [Latescibacteria bacterium DG_63]